MAGFSKAETERLCQFILDVKRGNGAYARRKMNGNLDLKKNTLVF